MYMNLPALHRVAAVAALVLSMGAVATAHQFKVSSIVIDDPWMRATPAGAKVAGGYLTITNTGSESDRLIGVLLPQAGHGAVHEMKMDGNVMKMRESEGGLEIKPGQKIEFGPGGYHLMFTDLQAPIKQGEMLKGQLRFEKAGTVDIEYRVEAVGAQHPHQHNH